MWRKSLPIAEMMRSVMPFSEGKSMGEGDPQNVPPAFPGIALCVAGKGARGAHRVPVKVRRWKDRLLQVSQCLTPTLPKRPKHPVLKLSVESKKQAGSGQATSTSKNTRF